MQLSFVSLVLWVMENPDLVQMYNKYLKQYILFQDYDADSSISE